MAIPNPKVKQLQQALTTYARVTGFSAANPGAIDGVVGIQTISAVIAMIPLIPKLPDTVKAIAPLGPLILINSDARARATKFITDNADKITNGIIGLAAYQAGTGRLPVPVGPGNVGPGGGGTIMPSTTIFFLDRKRRVYRIAVPSATGLFGVHGGNLGASYTEVAPSSTRPNGTEVTKTDFLTATGQWYATWWGIGILALGGAAAVTGTALVVRKAMR